MFLAGGGGGGAIGKKSDSAFFAYKRNQRNGTHRQQILTILKTNKEGESKATHMQFSYKTRIQTFSGKRHMLEERRISRGYKEDAAAKSA